MSKIFVANWKMNLSARDAIAFVKQHAHELNEYAHKNKHLLLVCPSYEVLYPISIAVEGLSNIRLGAQDCSPYHYGPYTGQIAAHSLAQVGVTSCIVGHYETQRYCPESDDLIAAKIARLWENAIQPIVCIGEDKRIHDQNMSITYLEKRLHQLLAALTSYPKTQPLAVAYEPLWAIGSGVLPSHDHLSAITTWLKTFLESSIGNCQLFYGGSVSEHNLPQLTQQGFFDGFLIGTASVDFQKLKNIVSWSS